jgi:hypothetical protein
MPINDQPHLPAAHTSAAHTLRRKHYTLDQMRDAYTALEYHRNAIIGTPELSQIPRNAQPHFLAGLVRQLRDSFGEEEETWEAVMVEFDHLISVTRAWKEVHTRQRPTRERLEFLAGDLPTSEGNYLLGVVQYGYRAGTLAMEERTELRILNAALHECIDAVSRRIGECDSTLKHALEVTYAAGLRVENAVPLRVGFNITPGPMEILALPRVLVAQEDVALRAADRIDVDQ